MDNDSNALVPNIFTGIGISNKLWLSLSGSVQSLEYTNFPST